MEIIKKSFILVFLFVFAFLGLGVNMAQAAIGDTCGTPASSCVSPLVCQCDADLSDGVAEGTCQPVGTITICSPTSATSFDGLIYSITNFIFNIAIALVPIMIIIAGFYFITAAGDPEKIKTARKIILWTFVGLLIILLTYGLIDVLEGLL